MNSNIEENFLEHIICPECGMDLEKSGNFLICGSCGEKYHINGTILDLTSSRERERELFSRNKWEEFYNAKFKDGSFRKDYEEYAVFYLQDTLKQISKEKEIKDAIYLEIGCGFLCLGQNLSSSAKKIIGIDFSLKSLEVAEKLLIEKGIKNYILIRANLEKIPLREGCVDFIYGGGVIEHFENSLLPLKESFRVLKKGGISFNTVPPLNLGTLTYGQTRGNIPDFPVLKQLAVFIHKKVLSGKYMVFGYEKSFLSGTLKRLHKKAGFSSVKVEKFEVKTKFELIRNKSLKKILQKLSQTRLFYPMIKAVAKK